MMIASLRAKALTLCGVLFNLWPGALQARKRKKYVITMLSPSVRIYATFRGVYYG